MILQRHHAKQSGSCQCHVPLRRFSCRFFPLLSASLRARLELRSISRGNPWKGNRLIDPAFFLHFVYIFQNVSTLYSKVSSRLRSLVELKDTKVKENLGVLNSRQCDVMKMF